MSNIRMDHRPEIFRLREEIRFRLPPVVKNVRAVGTTEREVEFTT